MSAAAPPRYQLGLSLSGAISAGAYSAGVLDFLFQALDCWEAAAASADIPTPAVGLKVLSGASAGAITAAVAAIALAADPESQAFEGSVAPGTQLKKYVFRRLYETWVVKPALVSAQGGTDLLSLSDLHGEDVLSILNAHLLDEIAADALDFTTRPVAASPPRHYVSGTLHIYITLANLRGTPYYVPFTGGTYGMMQHGDRAHYVLTGFGAWHATSDFADMDTPSRKLDAADLRRGGDPHWTAYGHAALASAAFPVGLAPRVIQTSVADYDGRRWPVADWPSLHKVVPQFDSWSRTHPAGTFTYTSVDGGVINNDPFEYALYSMPDAQYGAGAQPAREKTGLQDADRGIFMIAPFPEQPTLPPDGVPGTGLIEAYMALMPALKQQARFKPGAFALAGDDNVGSRFMISPSRPLTETIDARFPIASGLLNGFGGFVARAFRDHDFQLGRRNCQRFLQTTFWLAPDNDIIKASYAQVGDTARFAVTDLDHPGIVIGRQVIPLLGEAALTVAAPEWPRITRGELDTILHRLDTRLGKVVRRLLLTRKGMPILKVFADVAGRLTPALLRRTILRSFLADLVKRDQIQEWMLPPGWAAGCDTPDEARAYEQDTRAVIGALLAPAFDLRTIDGLVMACDLEKPRVEKILAQCEAAESKPYQLWRSPWVDSKNSRLVCLLSDRPSWLKRQFGKNHAGSLFFPPKIDLPVEAASPAEAVM